MNRGEKATFLDPESLAKGLGWFSIGLGLIELAAPGAVARMIGLRKSRPALMRALGLRECSSGMGILTQKKSAGWLWSRVAGDVMDIAMLAAGSKEEGANKRR